MELLEQTIEIVATLAEGAAVLLIGYALAQGIIRVVGIPFRHRFSLNDTGDEVFETRLHLGRWLSLALEFLLAADIVKTALSPTWSEIGILVVISALRTALNYFLEKEIEQGEQRLKGLGKDRASKAESG